MAAGVSSQGGLVAAVSLSALVVFHAVMRRWVRNRRDVKYLTSFEEVIRVKAGSDSEEGEVDVMAAGTLETLKQRRLHKGIPITSQMGIRVELVTGDTVILSAPAQLNVNIHGTGFAGSIHSIAVLAGHLLLSHFTETLGYNDRQVGIVVKSTSINYMAPTRANLLACCRLPADTDLHLSLYQNNLRQREKAYINLSVTVYSVENPRDFTSAHYKLLRESPSAELVAQYVAVPSKQKPSSSTSSTSS